MLGILMYCIGVMYTPGPVNILSLHSGVQRKFYAHAPFCFGVSAALCFWFLLVGYAGGAVVNENVMPVIAVFGVCFILFLACKIIFSKLDAAQDAKNSAFLTFRDGLFIQLLNPKSFLVVLPVATVQFPAAGIEGAGIAFWSIGLAAMGFGAPLAYAAMGSVLARNITKSSWFTYLNYIMGLMLVAVAMDMAYQHVYLALR